MENFQELTEKIFRQTYGFPSENLEGEELDKIRDAVIELRKSYASNVCTPLYHREEIRKAYMFAYYPYYIQPVYEVLTQIFRFKKMSETLAHWREKINPIRLSYIAGGPCPEFYGTVMALKDRGFDNDIHAEIYDIEEGWRDFQNITLDLCKNYYGKNISINFSSGYDVMNSSDYELCDGTDILFMQNYLSHVSFADDFLESFKNIIDSDKFSTIIILDLNYGSTSFILDKICSGYFKSKHNLSTVVKNIDFVLTETHPNPSRGIQKIFSYEIDGIHYPKKYTKYYYAVLRKK